MKALSLEAPKSWKVIDVDAPAEPGPDEALVRVHRVGICGTDISAYLGKMPLFSYPRIPGHELGVEVLQVGAGVSNVRAGDHCSVEPYINDPASYASRRGRSNCCEKLQVLGVHRDGGLRAQLVVPARKLHPSSRLDYEQLALVETLAIGCHAVIRAVPREDEICLVIGAGPIGLSVVEFVRLARTEAAVVDLRADRLEFCKRVMGIKHTILASDNVQQDLLKATGGRLADVIFDATGSSQSMARAIDYLAPGGRLVFVGLTSEEIRFHQAEYHKKEATILASRNALADDFQRIIGLIETGQIDTKPWITHRCRFDQLIENFPHYASPTSGVIKAMVSVE